MHVVIFIYITTLEILHDAYVIHNRQPVVSPGHKINVALYKDEKPIVVKHDVGVGNYVEMKPNESLYFCCVEMENADQPPSDDHTDLFIAEFSPLTSVNLKHYPHGLILNVEENELTGQIMFLPEHM